MNIKLSFIFVLLFFSSTWANPWCVVSYHSEPLNLISRPSLRQQVEHVVQYDSNEEGLRQITTALLNGTELEKLAVISFLKSRYMNLRSSNDFSLSPKRSVSHIFSIMNNPLQYIKKYGIVNGLIFFLDRQRIESSPIKPLAVLEILLKFEEELTNNPSLEFFVFGSFPNGLANRQSDIDFIVSGRGNYKQSLGINQKLIELGLDKITLSPKEAYSRLDSRFFSEIAPALLENNRVGVHVLKGKFVFFILSPENKLETFEITREDFSRLIHSIR